MQKLLIATALAAATAIHASIAMADDCWKDNQTVTIQGTADTETMRPVDGKEITQYVIKADQPHCVFENWPGDSGPANEQVTTYQIIGQAPPLGTHIELTGTISTGNVTEGYVEPTALEVISGRKLPDDQVTSLPSAPPTQGRRMDAALNPATALDGVIIGPMSAATPEPSDAIRQALQDPGHGTAKGLNEFPGALVCPDFDAERLMFDWINQAFEEHFQDVITGGRSEILHQSPGGPNLALHGCAIIPAGTAIDINAGMGRIPIVRAIVNGQIIEGVTLADMVE